jgi:hypothetical protein
VLCLRAARRYRWRLAGGRLIASEASLRFAPNPLERRRADTHWESAAEDITGIRAAGRMWLVVETASGAETFRVRGAAAAAPRLTEALGSAVPGYVDADAVACSAASSAVPRGEPRPVQGSQPASAW